MKTVEQEIRHFGNRLKRDFAQEMAPDPATFKKQVVRLIRRELRLRPGRPPSESVTRALKLRAVETPWLQVYRACISDFDTLGDGLRQLAMSRLRSAVRARRNRV